MKKRIKLFKSRANSLISKTFFSIISIALAALLLVSAILFLWFRTEMIEEYRQLTRVSISNTDIVFSQYMKNTKNLAITWYNSSDGKIFRINESYNMMNNMSFVSTVQNSITNIPYIHSVYVLNRNKKVSFMVGNGYSFTEKLDGLLENKLENVSGTNRPFAWNVKNKYAGRNVISLLTVYSWEAPISASYYTGAVIINIDANQLSKSLFAEVGQENLKIFILDENGIVVAHSDMKHSGEDWLNQEWCRTILEKKKETFETKIDGTHWEMNVLKSSQSGFYIVAQSEYINEVNNANGIVNLLLLILLVTFVGIVIITLPVCQHLFKPFHNMILSLKQSSMVEINENSYDEVKFLNNFYQQLAEHISVLNKREEKDFIVKNLLLGNQSRDIQSLFLRNEVVSAEHGYYAVTAYISDDESEKMQSMQEYDMKRNIICSIYSSILNELGYCTYFEIGLRRMLFLVSESQEKSLTQERLKELIQNAQKSAIELSNSDVITLVSERAENGLFPCALLFRQTEERLKTKLLLNRGEISMADMIPDESILEKLVKPVIDAVKRREKEAYLNAIEKLLQYCENCTYKIFLTCIRALAEKIIEIREKALSNNVDINKQKVILYKQLEKINNKEELLLMFDTLYNEATVQIKTVNSHSTVALMEDAVDYIRNNYDDCMLSVNMLADKLNISAPYFGKLFREFSGCSAIGYITKIRMEKAHDMLISESGKEISVIAQNVGYSNNAYFATAFKKYYGVSPSKLRDYNVVSRADIEQKK